MTKRRRVEIMWHDKSRRSESLPKSRDRGKPQPKYRFHIPSIPLGVTQKELTRIIKGIKTELSKVEKLIREYTDIVAISQNRADLEAANDTSHQGQALWLLKKQSAILNDLLDNKTRLEKALEYANRIAKLY